MNRRTLQPTIVAVAIAALLTSTAVAVPKCVEVRGTSLMTQPAGPFTEWVGPVTMKIRGRTYSGEGMVSIDPLLFASSGPPNMEGIGFDWLNFDFGEAGSFSAWELASFKAVDPAAGLFSYQGTARLGPGYVTTGVYEPSASGMFTAATGILHARGTLWMTFPDAPNSVDLTFSGRICGVQWR